MLNPFGNLLTAAVKKAESNAEQAHAFAEHTQQKNLIDVKIIGIIHSNNRQVRKIKAYSAGLALNAQSWYWNKSPNPVFPITLRKFFHNSLIKTCTSLDNYER
jgi:hypothetical protein